MNNHWKIITVATIFNVLFEYSIRGFINLQAQPVLSFFLFIIYFTLFIMLEDLVVRYKLKDYHLMILAFFYGTIYCAYTSGLAFINPSFIGIAWLPLLLVNVIWWGSIQAVLTFYLANLVSPRNWNHPKLSTKGWISCLVVNILAVLVFQLSGKIPIATLPQAMVIFILLAINMFFFILSLRHNQVPTTFIKNKVISFISVVSVCIFLFSAFFLVSDPILSNTSNVNATSLKFISIFTVIVFIVLLITRIVSKKEISV